MENGAGIQPVFLELLAPAKDISTGIAAIDHGADAVYIAAAKYGAREKAGNSVADIEKLCEYSHKYYSKVYVTVNTILFENELSDAENIINEVEKAGADAIIIQDYSVFEMNLGGIALHASTQMHNNSIEKIRFLEKCGIRRVVLPRELTVEEVKEIRKNSSAELEFFIHGALCVCYSGQCYMSQFLTGRSANRGACSQPCRSSYTLTDNSGRVVARDKHLLSLKDLNLSGQLGQLIDAGITSFKIEGRMKDAGYVKNTVAFYSKLLDNEIKQRDGYKRSSSGFSEYNFLPDPSRSFNRGFSSHFANGRKMAQASFNTQKATGKKIGIVLKTDKEWIQIRSNEQVSNGDGLCYFSDEGELTGFMVNKFADGKIFPNKRLSNIKPGTEIYRNYDIRFEKQLAGKSASRYVNAVVEITNNGNKISLRATDSDFNSFEHVYDKSFEIAHNPEMALKTIITQLSKSGDTIFRIENIVTSEDFVPPHIPIAELNQIRRNLLEGLLNERLVNYVRPSAGIKDSDRHYPAENVRFNGNISNSKSAKFMSESGVGDIEMAFEIETPASDFWLMETRYCLKYELGICPTKQEGKPVGKLFLNDSNYTYPLEFNCNDCFMRIGTPVKTQKNRK